MSISVLLVDDHKIVREGLRLLLNSQPDISVLGDAGDGREGVRLARELRPDVVVMDINMPVLNGIEAARQLFEVCPAAHVVVLSVHSASEHVLRAMQAGVRGYLTKEAAAMELITAVREVHAGRRYLSRTVAQSLAEDYIDRRDTAAADGPYSRLSSREREVLQLLVEGVSTTEIANSLHLSPKTVDTYRSRLMHKLAIGDMPGLVRYAIRHGLTSLD